MLAERGPAGERKRWAPWPAARVIASERALLLIVGLGAVIRFATLIPQGYWFDEWLTVNDIASGGTSLLGSLLAAESTPPLYYLVASGWQKVLGEQELVLRSMSAVLGTATIPVAYLAARAVAGSRRAGLVAAALTATSPLMIWYSQEARSYALFALLAGLSFLFFVYSLQGRNVRWVMAWGLTSALALAAHYFAIALIIPEAAWLLWRARELRVEVALSAGAVAAVGVTLAPLAVAQRGHVYWIPVLSGLDERLLQVPQHFLVGFNVPWAILPLLVGAALAAAVVYAVRRADPAARRAAGMACAIALAGFAITLAGGVVGSDYILSRNLIELWMPLVVALAAILGARTAGWAGPTVVTALCVLGVALSLWSAVTPTARRPDWESLTAALGQPQAERVIVTNALDNAPLQLYLPGARQAEAGERVVASELIVVAARPTTDDSIGPCWWVAFCGGVHLGSGDPEPPVAIPGGFKLVDSGATELFSYRRYRAARGITLPPADPFRQLVLVQQGS
jgi:mannosyltransferase